MMLTRLQKTLLMITAILFAFAYLLDGSSIGLLFGLAGVAIVVYVIHKLPKRSIGL
jgi:hypothetical protein